jgi:hypothetical protein
VSELAGKKVTTGTEHMPMTTLPSPVGSPEQPALGGPRLCIL